MTKNGLRLVKRITVALTGYSYFIIKSLNCLDHFRRRGAIAETIDVWKGQ